MTLHQGDCLDILAALPPGSVDMVFADLPYGTTANKWDSVIPFHELWMHLLRVGKESAVFVMTASQPFTSALVMSNLKLFRHEWIWIKNKGSNFLNVIREPMKEHESILVFSAGKWTYNQQMQDRAPSGFARQKTPINRTASQGTTNYGALTPQKPFTLTEKRVPSSWQKINVQKGLHPTQKPVDLIRYMIRTYSNPGDTILDPTMGSGTAGVAALAEGRNFIGIELDSDYMRIAKARIAGNADLL